MKSIAFSTRPLSRRELLLGCGALLLGRESSAIARFEDCDSQADRTWQGDSWADWMTTDENPVPAAWERKEGTIHLRKMTERTGHIVTRREYGDFVLEFEWKIAPGGNSGIKYRVRRYEDRMLGCEYQIYDPGLKSVDPKNQTGALYDLYEPTREVPAKPPGQWNQGVIRVEDNRVEHWLNGSKIVSATIGDPEWERRMAESKFNEYPDFARNQRGRIMLTDHGSEVWYRELKFSEL